MHAFALLQRLLPQHALSRCLGTLAGARAPLLRRPLIEGFKRAYRVDMAEFEGEGWADFETFNEFFTRPLLPGRRPMPQAPNVLACPADGTVSEAGRIEGGRLWQAKGRRYALAELLGDESQARAFAGGAFATIYLAPHNYHRVHAPCEARLVGCTAVPGRLFSVNATTERHIDALFAQNERLVLRLEAEFGPLALVLVGALIVASIRANWPAAPVSPYRRRVSLSVDDVSFSRGEEVAAFLLGSTVVVLLPPGVELAPAVVGGASVKMGSALSA